MSLKHVFFALAPLIYFSSPCCQATNTTRIYKTLEFEVPIDHFNFVSNKTFKIRYLLNDTYWDKDEGPIFFYTGNEGAIELFAKNTGFIWEIAEEFSALIVFAEHRYYGASMPFGNKSFSSPEYSGYLSSGQAMADYVDLIYHLKNNKTTNKNPVIAFGGSYGGMLAAYIRMKYPHVVAGSIAASAPILEFKDMVPCDAFYRIVTSNFKAESNACSGNIAKSWSTIRNLLKTTEGLTWLSKEWKLCTELKAEKTQSLIDWLFSLYTSLAMVNYPFECDFMVPLPANPVREFCRYLHNNTLTGKPLLQAMFSSLNVFTNHTKKTKCIDFEESTYNPDLGDEGWQYQSCTEFPMPMCSTGVNDMFEYTAWDEHTISAECKKSYGVEPSYQLAEKEYGGRMIKYASNIIFSNGLLDPWASGGVLKNLSASIHVILIPEGAHHLDLMESSIHDPYSVIVARNFHKKWIRNWIKTA